MLICSCCDYHATEYTKWLREGSDYRLGIKKKSLTFSPFGPGGPCKREARIDRLFKHLFTHLLQMLNDG